MRLSWVGRVALIVAGVLVVLAGVIAWVIEDEYGGGSAIETYQTGHLVDGAVELREIVGADAVVQAPYAVESIGSDQ